MLRVRDCSNQAHLECAAVENDSVGSFVRVIIRFLFPPTQDPCLIERSSLLRFELVDFLPLRNRMFSGSIGVSAAYKPVLQHSGLMIEQSVVFFALDADIKTDMGSIDCPVHTQLVFLSGCIECRCRFWIILLPLAGIAMLSTFLGI